MGEFFARSPPAVRVQTEMVFVRSFRGRARLPPRQCDMTLRRRIREVEAPSEPEDRTRLSQGEAAFIADSDRIHVYIL
jgi:hypothetical protein